MSEKAKIKYMAAVLGLITAFVTLTATCVEFSGVLHEPDRGKTDGGETGQTTETSDDADSGPVGKIRSDLTAMTAGQGCPNQTLTIRNINLVPTPASPERGGLYGAWVEVTLTVAAPSQPPKFLRIEGNGQGSDEASATSLASDRLLENVAQVLEDLRADCPS